MPEARIGKAIHSAMEHVLLGKSLFDAGQRARKGLTNSSEEQRFDALRPGVEIFIERVDDFRRRRQVDRQLVEFRLAMREDGTSTSFYANDAYFRGILDAAFLFDSNQVAVIDHKTGQRSFRSTITEQLEGYAVLAAAYFRTLQHLWLGIYWVSDAQLEWSDPVHIQTVREQLLPRVLDNIEAAALAVDDGPRPNPGVWCERCGYRTVCPAGQRVRFESVEVNPDEPNPGEDND